MKKGHETSQRVSGKRLCYFHKILISSPSPPSPKVVTMCSSATRTSTETVATNDVVDDIEDCDKDLCDANLVGSCQ